MKYPNRPALVGFLVIAAAIVGLTLAGRSVPDVGADLGFLSFLSPIISLGGKIVGAVTGAISGASSGGNQLAAADAQRFAEANTLYQRAIEGDTAASAQLATVRTSYPTAASRDYASNLYNSLQAALADKRRKRALLIGGAAVVGGVLLLRKG
jgi:hypothetical protein